MLMVKMRIKVIAVVAGSIVTISIGAFAFMILNSTYKGNIPLFSAGLATILCSIAGGYAAVRIGQMDSACFGALSGLAAAIVVLLATISLEIISTLGYILLVITLLPHFKYPPA
jgi:hypothetical protein